MKARENANSKRVEGRKAALTGGRARARSWRDEVLDELPKVGCLEVRRVQAVESGEACGWGWGGVVWSGGRGREAKSGWGFACIETTGGREAELEEYHAGA